MTEGITIGIASAKGGVGKTTLSINLATAIVTNTEQTVLLIEADLAMANVLDFLNLEFQPGTDPTLHDVLADRVQVEDAIYTASSGLDVLPCGADLDGFATADVRNLVSVVDTLETNYGVVVVDTAAGVSLKTLYPLRFADGVVLVSTPRASAVRDTKKTLNLVDRVGGSALGLVVNQTGTGTAPPPERLADFLGVPLLGSVPADEAVNRSQDAGEAVVTYDPDAPATKGCISAAANLEAAIDSTSISRWAEARE